MSDERLTEVQRTRIINSQRDAFIRHGYHPHALLWSNAQIQALRFEVLANIGIQTGDSVLDVGCGFGDFYAYLKRQQCFTSFTGIDISPELIEEGRRQYPDVKLLTGDIFDLDPPVSSVDYVTLSGTLNRKFEGSQPYSLAVIERLFATCKKGIAFNLLDARHEWTASRWDLQSFLPDSMIRFVSGFSERYQLIDDYLENDFTLYVYKDQEKKNND